MTVILFRNMSGFEMWLCNRSHSWYSLPLLRVGWSVQR